jgi:hypothetical protein
MCTRAVRSCCTRALSELESHDRHIISGARLLRLRGQRLCHVLGCPLLPNLQQMFNLAESPVIRVKCLEIASASRPSWLLCYKPC